MAENKKGIFGVVSAPWIYNTVQFLAGAHLYREKMVAEFIRPFDGCTILDIGCGTGEYVHYIQKHCKDFEYHGFDGEGAYIDYARQLFAANPKVNFYQKILSKEIVEQMGAADIVIATGVMHHMDDPVVLSLLQLAKSALKPGGRLVTYDPGKYEKMSLIESFFVKYDRGRSIRFAHEYKALIDEVFARCEAHVCYMTYYKSRNIVFECWN